MAIFMDWFAYDPQIEHSVMLVEPAMLLLYRTCETNPALTDRLVEFLQTQVDQTTNNFLVK